MRSSEHLRGIGLHLDIRDNNLIVSPKSLITPEVQEYIKSNKSKLLEEITGDDQFRKSGEAVLVHFPPLNADVWFCADDQAMERVKHEEVACFLYEDIVYIHKGKPGKERLSRLFEVYAMRHPTTQYILSSFNGKITSVLPKASGEYKT